MTNAPVPVPEMWLRPLLCLVLLFMIALPAARAQQVGLILFNEDDVAGTGFRDASFGFADGGDELRLVNGAKMPVEAGHAYSGATSGLLQFRHAGGVWELFIAREKWEPVDLSELDSLVLFVNGSEALPGAELPRLGLESANGNNKTPLVNLQDYLDELDADTTTWQRVSVPLSAFEPYGAFDLAQVKTVRFANGGANPATRILWIDYTHAVGEAGDVTPAAPPSGLVTRAGDRSVLLHWDQNTEANLAGYRVYRALSSSGPFEPASDLLSNNHFADAEVENGQTYHYLVRAVNNVDLESADSQTISATPAELDDEAFLDFVMQTAFDYFWYEANPENGLVRDRSRPGSAASVAAVGFGLSALTVGIDHGWITRAEGVERVLTTLRTFWNGPQGPEASGVIGYKGFFYHFLNMETATRSGTTELSTIDTALLLGGVLHVGEYFDRQAPEEAEVRALADSLYNRVDWTWAQVRPPAISHGWKPESGFIPFDYRGYNEAMLLYLLALGSPTHGVAPEAWQAYTGPYNDKWQTHYGYTFLIFPPLFGHQYSHVWIDFRGIRDAFMRGKGIDYFENSRRATLAQQAYAVANPNRRAGYGADMWGFTASDGPDGYRARGAPPAQNDDGTLTPTAPGGSYAFTPEASLNVLRAMYDAYRSELWGPYGFRDAFNPGRNWFASDYLGIDQGPILLMIENGRTGRVWEVFARNESIRRGLGRAGFTPAVIVPSEDFEAPPNQTMFDGAFPNPFSGTVEIRYTLSEPGDVTVKLYDALGREVAALVDGLEPAGSHTVAFDASALPGGVYYCVLRTANFRKSIALVHVP